jgi:hypothetical protein
MNMYLKTFDIRQDQEFSVDLFYEFCELKLAHMDESFRPSIRQNHKRYQRFSRLAWDSFDKLQERIQ